MTDECPRCGDEDCDGATGYACADTCYRCDDVLGNCDCAEPLYGLAMREPDMVQLAARMAAGPAYGPALPPEVTPDVVAQALAERLGGRALAPGVAFLEHRHRGGEQDAFDVWVRDHGRRLCFAIVVYRNGHAEERRGG